MSDRFRPPDASDEYSLCNGCQRKFHYLKLNEEGKCYDCAPEEKEEEEE